MKPQPLRHTLQGAINSRTAALRNGRSYRKDLDRVRAAIGRAEVFLREYPFATDEQVRGYCLTHLEDVTLIVPCNQPRVLAKLIMDELYRTLLDAGRSGGRAFGACGKL